MHSDKRQLGDYQKFLLNRVKAPPSLTEYITTNLKRDDGASNYSFHKIMVHNWLHSPEQLCEALADYFSVTYIPIQYSCSNNLASFYTSSLLLLLKIIKRDFMFPYNFNMYNIDILFNDTNSLECFDSWISVDDIVGGVVSNRLNEKLELDLSNLCNDPEFAAKQIYFYKLNLLSHFKILMLRLGRDAKFLNLSGNNLCQLPVHVLNFFKGRLLGLNLSNNNIPSISELQRYLSKIEKIWLEGNPFCETMDASTYVRQIIMKFPRVTEIDGIQLNQNGLGLPFVRNFAVIPDKWTKTLIDQFLVAYFSYFDHCRMKTTKFYFTSSTLKIRTPFTAEDEGLLPHQNLSPNKNKRHCLIALNTKFFKSKAQVISAVMRFPTTVHDPTTFCVDIMVQNNKYLMVIVDGVFKLPHIGPKNVFSFRRTFLFQIVRHGPKHTFFFIENELFTMNFATPEQIRNSFLQPWRNFASMELTNPQPDEKEIVTKALCYLTQLKKDEAERRLESCCWDIKSALEVFKTELKEDKIPMYNFVVNLDVATLPTEEMGADDIEEVD